MTDPCKNATVYAERLSKCKNLDELRLVWDEINLNMKELVGWYSWLTDWKDSCKQTLSEPVIPDAEFLNSEGLKCQN